MASNTPQKGCRREQQVWRFEKILDHRVGEEETEYLIHWTAWPENTWIKRSDFINSGDDLAQYWAFQVAYDKVDLKMDGIFRVDLIPTYKAITLQHATGIQDYTNVESRFKRLKRGQIGVIPAKLEYVELLIIHITELEVQGFTHARVHQDPNAVRIQQDEQIIQQPQQQQSQEEQQPQQQSEVQNQRPVRQPKRKRPRLVSPTRESNDELLEEEEEEAVEVEAKKFTCVHKGCGKSFGSNKQLVDHRRYHKDIPCVHEKEGCKWTGAVKKLNTHIREVHLKIFPFCTHCDGPVVSAKLSEHKRKCSKWSQDKRDSFLTNQLEKYPSAVNMAINNGKEEVKAARRTLDDDDGDDDESDGTQ